MDRNQLFETNAAIVKALAQAASKYCPKAHMLVISNPVNSMVPIICEVFRNANVYDKHKLFGVTTLDVVRAKTFIAELKEIAPKDILVNVIGGHSGETMVPVLSAVPGVKFTPQEGDAITKRIKEGGTEIVNAKQGAGSATLSMAYAGAHFANRLVSALNGKTGVIECAMVESNASPGIPFFTTPVELGIHGVRYVHPIGPLNAYEKKFLEDAKVQLMKDIQAGIEYAQKA